jgi:oxidoreductase domain protein
MIESGKPVRIAQIGVGHDHAADIMQTLRKLPRLFELTAYAVPDGEQLAADKENIYAGIPCLPADEILRMDDLDAIAVETEEKKLTKYALLAADRGLHIHMDKPGGMSIAEFSELIRIVKQKNLAFSLGYMYRYNPVVRNLIDRARAGEYGEIYSVEAHMDCLHSQEKRKWLKQFPGGMAFFLGCHLTDIIYSIQGMPQDILPLNTSTEENGGADFGMAVFRYPNGISFFKTCAREPGGFMRRQLVICGTKGTAIIEPLEIFSDSAARTLLQTNFREVPLLQAERQGWSFCGSEQTSLPFDRYENMLCAFYNMCHGHRDILYTPDYELNLFHLILRTCDC